MAVTLADVAARARVSAATVSRVLSGNYPVAESTRARVLCAVDELEYVVNGPASALAAATSDLVGVLVNDIADPFFGIIAGAVQSEICAGGEPGRAGEKLAVVCNTGGSPERELNYLTLLQRQRAPAVVLTGGGVENPEHAAAVAAKAARLAASGTRVVLCGRPPIEDAVTLTFDNRGGARRLTEHLLALGHRRIGYVAGPAERTTTRHRLEGHRAALADAGLGPEGGAGLGPGGGAGRAADPDATAGTGPDADRDVGPHSGRDVGPHPGRDVGPHSGPDVGPHSGPDVGPRSGPRFVGAERLTVYGPYDRASGYDATLELLRRDFGLTAIVAANDTIALGVCAALRDQGLRIPADVSVAGFDDLPFSADAVPALTTVRLPLHEAGARAGRLALGREAQPPGGVAMVRADLMSRASTAPPRAASS